MNKTLVTYFSCSGVTAKVAERIAKVSDADVFEIKPEVPYTKADLNWMNKKSRSSIEMADPASRPAVAEKVSNMSDYDVVFVGFPIWWYVAPTIINTFLESYDMAGKTVVLFGTSGGSGFGKTTDRLKDSCPGAILKEGGILKASMSDNKISDWIKQLGL